MTTAVMGMTKPLAPKAAGDGAASVAPKDPFPSGPFTGREALAGLCEVSIGTIDRWRTEGLLPDPVSIGRSRLVRWCTREIRAWFAAGCPSRKEWRKMRAESRAAAGE